MRRGFVVGNVRDTVKLALDAAQQVQRKNIQYSTGFTLAPGRYHLKFVVRENQTGSMGSFETDLQVPDLKKSSDEAELDCAGEPADAEYGEECGESRWYGMGWSGFRMCRTCFGRTSTFIFCTRSMTRRGRQEGGRRGERRQGWGGGRAGRCGC